MSLNTKISFRNRLEHILSESSEEEILSTGIVYKIQGHFFYAKNLKDFLEKDSCEVITLTLPTRSQKEGTEISVGDIVRMSKERTIIDVFERYSCLKKPKVANIDRAIVVISVKSPLPDLEHLDRLLVSCSLSLPQKPLICLTKTDLTLLENKDGIHKIREIYEPLGYEIKEVCNLTGAGIDDLKDCLSDFFCIVAGKSGVGKSSLINRLNPSLSLKTGEISAKSLTGTHTTRYSEIFGINFNNKSFYIFDTPGFSRNDLEFSLEELLYSNAFPELSEKKNGSCYFPDCTHRTEEGCTVKFHPSRKISYIKIVEECTEWQRDILESRKAKISQKKKSVSDKEIPLIDVAKRSKSRKAFRQEEIQED